MSRTRYTFRELNFPHFLTCTVVDWLPFFTNQANVQFVLESLQWLQKNEDICVYGYVIMENHLHLIAGADDLSKKIAKFKSFTARKIIDNLIKSGADRQLQQLEFAKLPHKRNSDYQFWQEGSHTQAIQNEDMMRQKLDYMHNNPVRRGYVDEASQWRYSSARDYDGRSGLIPVTVSW